MVEIIENDKLFYDAILNKKELYKAMEIAKQNFPELHFNVHKEVSSPINLLDLIRENHTGKEMQKIKKIIKEHYVLWTKVETQNYSIYSKSLPNINFDKSISHIDLGLGSFVDFYEVARILNGSCDFGLDNEKASRFIIFRNVGNPAKLTNKCRAKLKELLLENLR